MQDRADDLDLLRNPPTLRFDDSVVWVTGATRGLGRATALAMAGAGARLMLSAQSQAALEEVATVIEEHGTEVQVVTGSVSDEADMIAAADAIESTFGRLDVLINNAGISPHFTRAESLDVSGLREVLDTNLIGAITCARAAFPLLLRSDAASVVNVSSVHGSRAHVRMLAYAASKGGIEMVTRTLAEEWADRGIRVNSLAPGYIETAMTEGLRAHDGWREKLLGRIPMSRFATTAEIASCVLFLASPASSYVTGTTLFADGGWTAR